MSTRTNPRRQARKHAAKVQKITEGVSTFAACDNCFGYQLLLNGLCLQCSLELKK